MIEKAISALPQFKVIQQFDAERWVAGINRYHKDAAGWHAKRLSGIGGSEIGAVIRGVKGLKESGFSNHRKVVQDKLLKRLPEFQTQHMKRGTVLEDLARLAFMYRYGAAQDIGALNALNCGSGRPGFEWLIGNSDDIVMLGTKRLVNDYKVPATFSEDIEFDYDAQVHHYALKARFAGVKIDGLLLTKLDLAPELAQSMVSRVDSMTQEEIHAFAKTIAVTNVPGMRVVALRVDMRKEMDLDILDCGSYLWNDHVLAGHIPQVEAKPVVELPETTLFDIGRYQQQYAMAKAGAKHLEVIARAAAEGIANLLEGTDITDKAMPLGLVKVAPPSIDKKQAIKEALRLGATEEELQSNKKDYSIVALIEEIKRLNGDAEADHLFARSSDPAKAEAFLKGRNFDFSEIREAGVSVALSTKTEHKSIGRVYGDAAEKVFFEWVDTHSISGELDDSLEGFAEDLDASEIDALEEASGTLQELFADEPVSHADDDLTKPKRPMTYGAGMR